ncbi:MAG: hypothetical protein JXB85_01365 [Anaerolineales bacterium]|nr:hypothetical protein [Anaerolineales bacterium]
MVVEEYPPSPQDASSRSNNKAWIIAGIVVVILCLCCLVLAVGGTFLYRAGMLDFMLASSLDPLATPRSGPLTVESGFLPDPFIATTDAGGTRDTTRMDLGAGCVGFTEREPNFALHWRGHDFGSVRLYFVSDTGADTALLISAPDGQWYCNDNASTGGLDPMVDIFDPIDGVYTIWVSGLTQGETSSGTLFITELGFDPQNPYGGYDLRDYDGPPLDLNASPTYGSDSLSGGFSPDPYEVFVTAGGPVDVYMLGLSSGCTGYTETAPSFSLYWSGSTSELNIFFMGDQNEDTTLVINTPDGGWLCNDDSGYSYDPLITIRNPGEGRYDIWVGTYWSDETAPGTLYVTSDPDVNPGSLGGGGGGGSNTGPDLDYSLPSVYGETLLEASFAPDPFTVEIVAGGPVDVWDQHLGDGCTGYASPEPTFSFWWEGNATDLRIYFVPDDEGADTTMIINTVYAEWVCNDDYEPGVYSPLIELDALLPGGRTDIWVGSFWPGESIPGTLYITTGNSHP